MQDTGSIIIDHIATDAILIQVKTSFNPYHREQKMQVLNFIAVHQHFSTDIWKDLPFHP